MKGFLLKLLRMGSKAATTTQKVKKSKKALEEAKRSKKIATTLNTPKNQKAISKMSNKNKKRIMKDIDEGIKTGAKNIGKIGATATVVGTAGAAGLEAGFKNNSNKQKPKTSESKTSKTTNKVSPNNRRGRMIDVDTGEYVNTPGKSKTSTPKKQGYKGKLYESVSIVDFLKSKGLPSDFESRKIAYEQAYGDTYTGSTKQNNKWLDRINKASKRNQIKKYNQIGKY